MDAMRCVHGGWIQEQLNYFNGAYHKRHHSLHGWHNLGFVVTLAGLFLMAACWVISWKQPPFDWLAAPPGQLGTWGLMLIGIAAIWRLVMHAINLILRTLNKTHEAPEKTQGESPVAKEAGPEMPAKKKEWSRIVYDFFMPQWKSGGRCEGEKQHEAWYWYVRRCLRHWRALVLDGLKLLVEHLTPAWDSTSPPLARFVPVFLRSVYDFLALLPISLAIALLTMSAAHCVGHTFKTGPDEESLRIIAAGMLVLFGAMSIAWVEKNFDSELSYQYNNMAGLFQHANQRMTRLLSELEQAHAKLEAAADSSKQKAARAEFDRTLAETQGFLFEVGIEALDENAEWLILHRSRPMEPVMAG